MTDQNPKIEIDADLLDEAVEAVDGKNPEEARDTKPAEPTGEEFKDRWIRTMADFDNFRKRTQKEKGDLIKFGNENLIKELLPILDNFERALSSSQGQNESIMQGVKMIYTQLMQTLERFGLTSESAKGQPFDPHLHEAMSHVESSEFGPNMVVDEHQKMCFLHKKLIRPALVTVSKDSTKQKLPSTEAPTVEFSPKFDENS